jgi:hypothetical protein
MGYTSVGPHGTRPPTGPVLEPSQHGWCEAGTAAHRGFLVASTGGPLYYAGCDMTLSHKGMRINESDWTIFLQHADATLKKFNVPKAEYDEVVAFVQSTKADIVEA